MTTVFMLLVTLAAKAQQLDSCGLDDTPTLNHQEATYLNFFFKDTRGSFNFLNKSAVFITGSSGHTIGTKSAYFRDVSSWMADGNSIVTSYAILNVDQVNQSGGYEVILFYWVKVSPSPKAVIRKINARTSLVP
ncbi:hypothetical protein [Hymenobacter weizhouensis]|uniref:hypothetical protein n=1 Tax=Hymenobacter sp. YIM 151500-1 TaxID=2987689 RepID=UPI002226FB1C|nr:hypothetical protein [Hymenobacter sp. YIM 151500-1]UYZ63783.1 hypothetical protein OIS53_02820 [Hymenobacter sp. YIM 151500-1]